jgi:hypothetical protein
VSTTNDAFIHDVPLLSVFTLEIHNLRIPVIQKPLNPALHQASSPNLNVRRMNRVRTPMERRHLNHSGVAIARACLVERLLIPISYPIPTVRPSFPDIPRGNLRAVLDN